MSSVLRKIGTFLLTILLVSAITFTALQVLPGDPAILILGTDASPEALELMRSRLGLDQPALQRYFSWLGGMVRGDFGRSIRYDTDVAGLLRRALPVTLSLAFFGVSLSLLIALPAGIFCATRPGRWSDYIGLIASQLGLAVPGFWLGMMLIHFFALRLGWLPPGGYQALQEAGPQAFVLSLLLPAVALSLPRAAILTRMVRTTMLEQLQQEYVQTARSKGLAQAGVLYHALRNAAVTIVTVAGIHWTQLMAGTVVIEQVFHLPGIGRLLLNAVLQRDLPLVQGIVVVGAALILAANLVFDLMLTALDPRIRAQP